MGIFETYHTLNRHLCETLPVARQDFLVLLKAKTIKRKYVERRKSRTMHIQTR